MFSIQNFKWSIFTLSFLFFHYTLKDVILHFLCRPPQSLTCSHLLLRWTSDAADSCSEHSRFQSRETAAWREINQTNSRKQGIENNLHLSQWAIILSITGAAGGDAPPPDSPVSPSQLDNNDIREAGWWWRGDEAVCLSVSSRLCFSPGGDGARQELSQLSIQSCCCSCLTLTEMDLCAPATLHNFCFLLVSRSASKLHLGICQTRS